MLCQIKQAAPLLLAHAIKYVALALIVIANKRHHDIRGTGNGVQLVWLVAADVGFCWQDQELLATRSRSHENGAHQNESGSGSPFTINPLMREGGEAGDGPGSKVPTITVLQRESPSEPATLMHRCAAACTGGKLPQSCSLLDALNLC